VPEPDALRLTVSDADTDIEAVDGGDGEPLELAVALDD
jgi:hypothetical protein